MQRSETQITLRFTWKTRSGKNYGRARVHHN